MSSNPLRHWRATSASMVCTRSNLVARSTRQTRPTTEQTDRDDQKPHPTPTITNHSPSVGDLGGPAGRGYLPNATADGRPISKLGKLLSRRNASMVNGRNRINCMNPKAVWARLEQRRARYCRPTATPGTSQPLRQPCATHSRHVVEWSRLAWFSCRPLQPSTL